MPINAHPDYIAAEGKFHLAQTSEEQLTALEEMIRTAPGHKGAENLRAQLKTRYKKLKEKISKAKKSGKSSQKGIKKEDMQAAIIGKTNSGKSSLLESLTNAKPKISEFRFQTKEPIIGMMAYATTQIQIIENPSLDSELYNKGLTNSADTIIILITALEELKEIDLEKARGKVIIAFNKIDLLSNQEKRKLEATLKSKKYNYVMISTKTKEGLEDLKEKLFQSFDNLRIFTKDPNKKEAEKKPVIMKPHSTVKDVAEKILHGFSKRVKQTKIWGPSSKFPGQKVGLTHKLKDMDIIEFKTN